MGFLEGESRWYVLRENSSLSSDGMVEGQED